MGIILEEIFYVVLLAMSDEVSIRTELLVKREVILIIARIRCNIRFLLLYFLPQSRGLCL